MRTDLTIISALCLGIASAGNAAPLVDGVQPDCSMSFVDGWRPVPVEAGQRSIAIKTRRDTDNSEIVNGGPPGSWADVFNCDTKTVLWVKSDVPNAIDIALTEWRVSSGAEDHLLSIAKARGIETTRYELDDDFVDYEIEQFFCGCKLYYPNSAGAKS